MSSAIATRSLSDLDALAVRNRADMDSGEFIVMVAAVDSASHAGLPSLCSVASFSILLYRASI
jgi:hypothetical protein